MAQPGGDSANIPGVSIAPAPDTATGVATARPVPVSVPPPQLLWPLSSRWRTFANNLADLVLFRTVSEVAITSHPGKFWPDVFVDQRLSKRALADSALIHVFAV